MALASRMNDPAGTYPESALLPTRPPGYRGAARGSTDEELGDSLGAGQIGAG